MSLRAATSRQVPRVGRLASRLDEVLRAGQIRWSATGAREGDGSNVGDQANPFRSHGGHSFGPPVVAPVPTLPAPPPSPPPAVADMAGLNVELRQFRDLLEQQVALTAAQARRVFQLREQIEIAHADMAKREAEHGVYARALESAQRELQEQLRQVDEQLTGALASLDEERRVGRVSAEDHAKVAAQLRSEAENLRSERSAARELLQEALAGEVAARRARGNLQAEFNALQRSHDAVVAMLESQRSENAELQETFDNERERLRAQQAALSSALESAKAERDGCEERLRQAEEELEACRSRADSSDDEEWELRSMVSDRDAELAQKNAKVQELKEQIRNMVDYNKQRAKLEEELARCANELAALRAETESKSVYNAQELERLLREQQELQNRLVTCDQAVAAERKHVQAEKAALARNIEECEDALDARKREFDTLEAEAKRTEQEMQRKIAELEYGRNAFSKLMEEKDECERDLAECRRLLGEQRAKVDRLARELDLAKEENRAMKAENEAKQRALEEANATTDELRAADAARAEELARARQRIEELQVQVYSLEIFKETAKEHYQRKLRESNKCEDALKACEEKLKAETPSEAEAEAERKRQEKAKERETKRNKEKQPSDQEIKNMIGRAQPVARAAVAAAESGEGGAWEDEFYMALREWDAAWKKYEQARVDRANRPPETMWRQRYENEASNELFAKVIRFGQALKAKGAPAEVKQVVQQIIGG
jgi:DNA repair exonuclease SbcCD ATPase subunit